MGEFSAMSAEALWLLLCVHAVALVSPGPDFAVVTRLSIVSGRRSGLWAAAGVAVAIGIYVWVCAMGLSVILAALPDLSRLLALAGVFYLGWLGLQCLLSRGEMPQAQAGRSSGKAFVTGFMTNLLNPKAMLYFGSILSQAMSARLAVTDVILLWALLVGESLLWFSLVATVFSSQKMFAWLRQRRVWFDRAIGVVLLGLAAKLAGTITR